MSEAKRMKRAYRDEATMERLGRTREADLELRVRMLLRNGLTSKSGMTLADTEVLAEIVKRLGYDPEKLKTLDITDSAVNLFAKLPPG